MRSSDTAITYRIMRVTPITPTTGPISMDDDLDMELEMDGLVSPGEDPLAEPEANPNAGDEGQETQEGLARLIDFLKEKKKRQRDRKAGPWTKADFALDAYQRIIAGAEDLRGQKIDLKK